MTELYLVALGCASVTALIATSVPSGLSSAAEKTEALERASAMS